MLLVATLSANVHVQVKRLNEALFIALSADEATAVDNESYLCTHAYIMGDDWKRKPLFIELVEVSNNAMLVFYDSCHHFVPHDLYANWWH
jgi:hypothetical protein